MKVKSWIAYFSLIFFQSVYAVGPSPIGTWKTIDDVTGEPKAIVKIWQAANQTLVGRIEKVFPKAGNLEALEICKACIGERHNKPIVGMVILWGLKQQKQKEWSGGEILDPKNGKTYHSIIRLTANDQKLNVRGYIGMPLFGRSQTWLRIS
jgi:uncharacterized protein (DUF2147 family)